MNNIKSNSNIFKTVALLLGILVLLYIIVMMSFEVDKQTVQIEELKRQLEEQQERVGKLRYELDRPYDDEYAIEIARDKLNLHLPGEIVYYNGSSD